MSAPVPTLRIDTSGTAFGAAPTYTDRTSYLMTGSQYPVEVTFGRQDEQSEPQPSTCSFFLSNANGFWTPGAGVGPAGWDIGCPVNVRLTANAVTYDRFTGFVDAIEPTWPGGVQSWSVVKVSCTDVSARLGIAKPLRSLVLHEMLADSPTYLFPLAEDVGASSSADIVSGYLATRWNSSAGANQSLSFGANLNTFDAASGVAFGDAWSTSGSTPGLASVLQIGSSAGPFVPSGGAHTLEAWVVTPSAAPGSAFDFGAIVSMQDAELSSKSVYLRIHPTTGVVMYETYQVGASVSSTANVCDGNLHHIVGTMNSARTTLTLYVDGAQVGTTSTFASVFTGLTSNVIGGHVLYGNPGYQFPGTVALVAMYPSALSASRVLAHYQAGVGTGPVERSDQRFSRVAAYGGITTSGLPTGVATMGGQATSGQPAITALGKVARTEGTFAYVTTAGALTFQGRQHRYQRSVELALTSSDIATPGVRRDRQGVANELTVTREGGASQVVTDSTSQTAVGRFDGGSFEVCPSTDEDAWQNATWQVQNRKTTRTRLPDLTVDLYRQTSTAVVASCLSATIGTKAQVTSLPANAPAATMTLFVEGYTETIGYDRWSMGFYTSPIGLEDSVLVLDNATTGVLDTYRLGF